LGEITDALRRARGERDAQPAAAPEVAPPVTLRPAPPVAAPEPAPEPVTISRQQIGAWQARAVHIGRPNAAAERFRHLAVRVRHELEQRRAKVLLVASALRQEGKTVTSCNLALALASMASERRIALLDLDLRRPSVASALGVRPRVGIDRALQGDASLGSVRIPTEIPTLDLYLAAGPVRQAHELLAGPALARVLAELRERYAVIVADTPPVLLVPDVPLVAPQCDAIMVVARAGRTARSSFRDMLRLLPQEKLIGGFLNQVRAPLHTTEYGYYLGEDDADDDEARSERDR
jgi:capsular exopolysaccharide synthesis family protein